MCVTIDGACDGRMWGVRGGRVGGGGGGVVERKYRSPLYYPDTLVNPDTCLGLKVCTTIVQSRPWRGTVARHKQKPKQNGHDSARL